MPETHTPIRALCMRETDNSFYLAVSRPFNRGTVNYKNLRRVGHCAVYQLEDSGSQVFVYSRADFANDEELGEAVDRNMSDVDLFTERILLELQHSTEHLALDPHVTRVEDQIRPLTGDSVLL